MPYVLVPCSGGWGLGFGHGVLVTYSIGYLLWCQRVGVDVCLQVYEQAVLYTERPFAANEDLKQD